ncbi:hypothetical protein [Azospirillum sp. sgz301742]
MEVDTRLIGLLSRSIPGVEFVSDAGDASGPFERFTWAYRATPRPEPWLKPPYDLRGRYGAGPVVGLSWHSEGTHGALRSVPVEQMGEALAGLPVTLVSLQYGARDVPPSVVTDPMIDPLRDLDGFAAQVAACDAVVSIDNSTTYFAGALGVPTCVLTYDLFDPNWSAYRRITHPTTQRPRQVHTGDWSAPLAVAREFVARLVT